MFLVSSADKKKIQFFALDKDEIILKEKKEVLKKRLRNLKNKKMKNPKLILAYLSIPFFCVFGFILILSLIEYKQGNEGYGIVMAVISGFAFYPIIILGLISLMIDFVEKRKPLPKLTWILLIYPLFTILHLFLPNEWEIINMEVVLLIACVFSIGLVIKDILRNKKESINFSEE